MNLPSKINKKGEKVISITHEFRTFCNRAGTGLQVAFPSFPLSTVTLNDSRFNRHLRY
jgi:hypothetical protein